ncbi:MAG: hypothetical protein AAGE61_00910 [Pseudomonadota bacterium]
MGGNILAIDPGLNNGLAVLDQDGSLLMATELQPIDTGANRRLNLSGLSLLCAQYDVDHAVIEDVASMPGQGLASTFRFGCAAGAVEGALQALHVPIEFVRPATWKKALGAKAKDAEDIRALAIQRWPSMAEFFSRKKDHNRAEAALIALWFLQTRRSEN